MKKPVRHERERREDPLSTYFDGWTESQILEEWNKVRPILRDESMDMNYVWVACSASAQVITSEKVYLLPTAEARKLGEDRTADYWYQHENVNPKMI